MDKGVIFDLDGVLVDTGDCHRQSWIDLCKEEGWIFDEAFFLETFGMQNREILPVLAKRELNAEELQSYTDRKEKSYRNLIAGNLNLLEGVEKLLTGLRKAGFGLAVGSSTPRVNLDFMLEQTGAANWFDDFVTAEDVTNSKPAPDTFLKAAKKLGLPPHACVVVEDAVPGVAAGKAGGMAVVAVTNTRSRELLLEADRIVDSLTELGPEDFDALLKI